MSPSILAILVLSATLQGTAVSIHDGDTATLLDAANVQHKIRLAGIDAPEVGHGKRRPGQPFGVAAKQALSDKIHGKRVSVEVSGNDKYGREIGTVFVDDRNVNREMVAEGWAWWYRRYAPKDEGLRDAEREARDAKLGLWSDERPIEPWVWRKWEVRQ